MHQREIEGGLPYEALFDQSFRVEWVALPFNFGDERTSLIKSLLMYLFFCLTSKLYNAVLAYLHLMTSIVLSTSRESD